jgi:hypothetical protein
LTIFTSHSLSFHLPHPLDPTLKQSLFHTSIIFFRSRFSYESECAIFVLSAWHSLYSKSEFYSWVLKIERFWNLSTITHVQE